MTTTKGSEVRSPQERQYHGKMKDQSVNKSLASQTTGVRQTPSRGASASHKRGPPSRPGAFLDSSK